MRIVNYKLAICDDDREQLRKLEVLVAKWGEKSGHGCSIRAFVSAEEFLFEYEEDKTYDILLLDVEMNNISGIELAKRIRKDNNRAEIIFITSHFEFVGEGYEVDALHYLIKPVANAKLCQVLSKAVEKLAVEPPWVVINFDGQIIKLYEFEILYIEAFRHYISIRTTAGEYKIKENLSSFEQKLSNDFYRVHRSYLVSLKQITRISRTAVWIGKEELPLARGKYDDINRAFIEHN